MSALVSRWQSSLTVKLLAVLVMVITAFLVTGIALITWRNNDDVRELTSDAGRQLGLRYAAEIQGRLDTSLEAAHNLAQALRSLKASGVTDRAVYNQLIKDALTANPALFGTWAGFEPNALDGRDADFSGKAGTDASGRFLSYWSRGGQNGSIALDALVDYEDPANGAYYQQPKRTGRESITEPYAYPVNGKNVLMASIAMPIVIDGKVIGVAGVDLGLEQLWDLLKVNRPFGTGSLYLISNGGNWAAFAKAEDLAKPIQDSNKELEAALASIRDGKEFFNTGFAKVLDTNVRRQFVPIKVGETGTPWSLLVVLPEDKMMAKAVALRQWTIGAGILLVLVVAGAAAWVGQSMIGRPLAASLVTVEALSRGDLSVQVDGTARNDEIGRLNQALAVFHANATEMEHLRAENERQKEAAEAERRAGLQRIAQSFEASVKAVVQEVGAAASQMQDNSRSMTELAGQSAMRAATVASAAEQASANVQTVAAASDELTSSISEISRQMSQASTITAEAVEQSTRTGTIVASLVESAQRIGEVINLISDIANQTNMLALNATIEAARAGDAGKGFAVVAGEVKSLATQTARATGEIHEQVNAVQAVARQAVEAIEQISGTIDSISQISASIASAVEEQSAATQEIARNVDEAARGTHEVSSNIVAVNQATGTVGEVAEQVLGASSQLSQQSTVLLSEVDKFLSGIRAA